jgi:hypothetical protein
VSHDSYPGIMEHVVYVEGSYIGCMFSENLTAVKVGRVGVRLHGCEDLTYSLWVSTSL